MMDTVPVLTDEQRKLIEDNWLLSMFFLNRLKQQYGYDEETVYDWVTEAAIRTAVAYDPAKGSWTALYNWKLRGVIGHFVWTDTHTVKGESLDGDVYDDGGKTLHEVHGSHCQELDDVLSMISIQQTMDSLRVTKNQQKYIIDMVFDQTRPTNKDLAERYGVTPQGVTDAFRRVKRRFKKAVAKRGGAVEWMI